MTTSMQYTRIYTDSRGETQFEEVEVALAPIDFAPPAPPLPLSAFHAASQWAFCRFPSGWTGPWHRAPQRQLFAILAGEVEVQTGDGAARRFEPGRCVLVEDTTGQGHHTRVVGLTDVLCLVVQLSAQPSKTHADG